METLLANPAFRTYAFCTAILAFKMLYSAVYTGTRRSQHQGYVNQEDATVFGPAGVTASDHETAAVAHALRIQRNDLENIPLFFAIGMIFVLAGAAPIWAVVYCWAFTLARIAHTIAYTWNLQPWRAIFYGIGSVAILAMIVHIIIAVI